MKEFVISEAKSETAVLVGLTTKNQDEAKTKEYLDELEFLADTAGAVTVKRFTQKVAGPNSVTYIGTGKLEEIRQFIKDKEDEGNEVGMVIFDDELSAKQLRNIEKCLQVKILDRTSLILDIFAMRAQTAEAKTQVELAQHRYMLPRLQRLWTHLERQGGGSGSGGGGGGGAGFSVTFPATATNWGKISTCAIIQADGTVIDIKDYSTVAGKTIPNVIEICCQSDYSFYMLHITVQTGKIMTTYVTPMRVFATIAVDGESSATYTGNGSVARWIPLADTVISAIEMYNTD